MKVKRWENIYHRNNNYKMARVAIPVSDKQVFKTGNIMRQRYFIVKRGEISER